MASEIFARTRQAGGFLSCWSAHGLDYGLPIALADVLAQGRHVVANGSRAPVAEVAPRVDNFVVIEITAPREIVAQRPAPRAPESPEDVAPPIPRLTPPPPPHIEVP